MENVTFRKARSADIPQIIELQKRVFNGEQKIPADDIEGFLAKNPLLWCAVYNGRIISAAAAWEEDGVLHWGRFVTESGFRGKHIGTQMAQFSFDDIFSQEYQEVSMEAREITAKMVCKLGGQIAGEAVPFYAGTMTPVILKKVNYHHEFPANGGSR